MEIAIVTIGVVASINALVIFWVSKIHTKTLEKLHEEQRTTLKTIIVGAKATTEAEAVRGITALEEHRIWLDSAQQELVDGQNSQKVEKQEKQPETVSSVNIGGQTFDFVEPYDIR